MLRPIYTNMKDYIIANTGTMFKAGYDHVEMMRRIDRDGTEQRYPVYWEDGIREGRPLLSDFRTNYFYLRTIGGVASDVETTRDSCIKTVTNTYPTRLVVHLREAVNGYYGERRAIVFQQLMGWWGAPSTLDAAIEQVQIFHTGYLHDKHDVLEEETEGVDGTKIGQSDSLIAVDFDTVVTYTPAKCPIDDLFCTDELATQFENV